MKNYSCGGVRRVFLWETSHMNNSSLGTPYGDNSASNLRFCGLLYVHARELTETPKLWSDALAHPANNRAL